MEKNKITTAIITYPDGIGVAYQLGDSNPKFGEVVEIAVMGGGVNIIYSKPGYQRIIFSPFIEYIYEPIKNKRK